MSEYLNTNDNNINKSNKEESIIIDASISIFDEKPKKVFYLKNERDSLISNTLNNKQLNDIEDNSIEGIASTDLVEEIDKNVNKYTIENKTKEVINYLKENKKICLSKRIKEEIENNIIEDDLFKYNEDKLYKNKETEIHGQRSINFKAAFNKILNELSITINGINEKLSTIKINQDSYSMTVESSHYDSIIDKNELKKINKELLEKNMKASFKNLCKKNNVIKFLDILDNKIINSEINNQENSFNKKITSEVLDSHLGNLKEKLYEEINKADCTQIEARNKFLNEKIIQEREKYEYNKSVLEDLVNIINDELPKDEVN